MVPPLFKDWRVQLDTHFGDWKSKTEAWVKVAATLKPGMPVTGTVIARAPFGAWIDIGLEFPALLETIRVPNLNYQDYQAGRSIEGGCQIEAWILCVGPAEPNPDMIALSLTQEPPSGSSRPSASLSES